MSQIRWCDATAAGGEPHDVLYRFRILFGRLFSQTAAPGITQSRREQFQTPLFQRPPSRRQQFIVRLAAVLAVATSLFGVSGIATAGQQRPNILWISCEDISPHLGCYGDRTASTPNLDQLAADGTRFTNIFSCHGVCAPSRTGIITGMFPVALGANHMRSRIRLPEHVRLFPQLLRESGYFCTNNSKTDYNLEWNQKAVWDESSGTAHWKHRRSPDQPFFAVFNLTMTHESKVWPDGWAEVVKDLPVTQRHRAEDMQVPPLYPDTVPVREDFARLADLITVMDARAGQLLRELDEAGLREETIVFFWSDHGNGLPRSKRWTYDSGSRVPMIVRVPGRLREQTGFAPPGTVDDRLLPLIDLGPTVLQLAGIERPGQMHGRSMIGPDRKSGAGVIFGARDRLDERMDLVRTVRDRQFRYVRNLMPWRPALQHVSYGERNETMKEMRRLLAAGQLSPESAQWYATPRPAEELYDLDADPWELTNLAGKPEFHAELMRLSAECDRQQMLYRDVHLIPEELLARADDAGRIRAELLDGPDGAARLARLLEAARRTASLDPLAAAACCHQLSEDTAERWWQIMLIGMAPGAADRVTTLREESVHAEAAIRIAAAAGLARAGFPEESAAAFRSVLNDQSALVLHAAAREIDESGADVIRLLGPDLDLMGDADYIVRLREHALSLLSADQRP